MKAADLRCDEVVGLVGRWRDDDMAAEERDAFEQHLLFCPPCMSFNRKLGVALTALHDVAGVPVADAQLLDELTRLVGRS